MGSPENPFNQILAMRTIGFGFEVTIEYEKRIEGIDPKYSDKKTYKLDLSGHEETFDGAINSLKKAVEEIDKVILNGDEPVPKDFKKREE